MENKGLEWIIINLDEDYKAKYDYALGEDIGLKHTCSIIMNNYGGYVVSAIDERCSKCKKEPPNYIKFQVRLLRSK